MSGSVSMRADDGLPVGEDRLQNTAPVSLARILVALDASDHANQALAEAVKLAGAHDGVITGIHAYAAALHDRRFKQMEGGLPERYLEEREMQYQRQVHDDLITRGLNIISDSYHDAGMAACEAAEIPYRRLSPEGKNYAEIVKAANGGDFDLLAMGAQGLGAVPGSIIGGVCERVARRSDIDVLVIKDAGLAIGDGPIVVGVDGSARSYGMLVSALELGRWLGVPVHAVAAFDPYYHYVAFNKIAGVLSDEAGKVFRFKEQEKLHEELIDDGLAKIYQSHLDVAEKVAAEREAELTCKLLDGKAYKAVLKYVSEVGASLLMLGRTGVHADDGLDIGGNAENLLRLAPCHVWLGQGEYHPPMDVIAEETISWSHEAEAFLAKAPSFVQGMARKAVIRYAHDKGHTFVTSELVTEVMRKMMPGADDAPEKEDLAWSDEAEALLAAMEDRLQADNIRLRAEKKARRAEADTVLAEHVRPFLDEAEDTGPAITWAAAALARLSRSPEIVRDTVREHIEDLAAERGLTEVTLDLAEEGVAEIRRTMCPIPEDSAEDADSDA